MWLINTHTLKLEQFVDERYTKYAILSHRWAEGEVTFQQFSSDDPMVLSAVRGLKGFSKIEQCCRQALAENLQYAWVDTCCIDKSSSAELSEAVNSMFKYYQRAEICYAYLSDVIADNRKTFIKSQWFTRGWTLQELVVPQHMMFFDTHWRQLGWRSDLAALIQAMCGVPSNILTDGWNSVNRPCIATIMSWASGRSTTRVEDRAYSLLGLFGVNMPLLYGEGEKAFQRLQEEIFKCTEDQTIFAWEGVPRQSPFLFASSPDQFSRRYQFPLSEGLERRKPHMVTNEGIVFEARMLLVRPRTYLVSLSRHPGIEISILLRKIDSDGRYGRIPGWLLHSTIEDLVVSKAFEEFREGAKIQQKMITVVRKLRLDEVAKFDIDDSLAFVVLPDNFQNTEPCLTLTPFIGYGWISYHGDTASDAQRTLLAGSAVDGLFRREVHSSSRVIESGQYSLGPVAAMKTRPRAIRDGLLGFDNNFLPVCLISTRLVTARLLLSENMSTLFTSTDRIERLCEWFHKLAFDDDGSLPTEKLEVAAVSGGIYQELSSGVFVFTVNEREFYGKAERGLGFSGDGLVACILTKPVTSTPGKGHEWRVPTGAANSLFAAMRHISLEIYRFDTESPWQVGLTEHKTEDPSKQPQCYRCSQEIRRLVPIVDDALDWGSD